MFVSNVLNGVVTWIDLSISRAGDPIVESMTEIASGYLTQRTDPRARKIRPTVAGTYDAKNGTLYVASTGDNEIFAVPNARTRTSDAGTGSVAYQDNAPARGRSACKGANGDLIAANGHDAVNPDLTQTSELVEFHAWWPVRGRVLPRRGRWRGLWPRRVECRRGLASGRGRRQYPHPRRVVLPDGGVLAAIAPRV